MYSSLSAVAAMALLGGASAQYQTATSASNVYAAQATALTNSPISNVRGKAFDRIAFIYFENTDYDKAFGDPNFHHFAKKGITLDNYFGVTHPSEPNYVASHSGDNYGMDNDNLNFIPANVSTVIDLLEDKGISWAEYQEDMPYSGYEGFSWVNQKTKANDYVRKHNPAVIYNANSEDAGRLSQMKNFTLFYDDLENGNLPQWMFITPNMTSDGHDTSVTVAGAFLRGFLDPLLNDPRFMQNTLVVLTFDENETYTIGNRVLTVLIGDAVPKKLVGTTDSNYYNHYSDIATVEANWGLHTLGRWDVGANVYQFVADKTGDKLRPWSAATSYYPTRFFNESYAGAFNSEQYHPIPPPNTKLVKNGRKVLPQVVETWQSEERETIYEDTVQIPDGLNPPAGY